MKKLSTLLVLLALSGAEFAVAGIDIYRCVGEGNVPIFTDRVCSALGARDHLQPADVEEQEAPAHPILTQGCPRDIDTLQSWLRVALESDDVNQLSGLYHWTGATAEMAERLMPGLEVIAGRRLIDIELETVERDGVDHPAWLWLDQFETQRPGQTVRTGFRLIMSAGCWWLHG